MSAVALSLALVFCNLGYFIKTILIQVNHVNSKIAN